VSTTSSVETLVAEIRKANWNYWVSQDSKISDEAFDYLVRTLRVLAPDHPVLDEIGGASGDWAHSEPMLSLAKCYDSLGLRKWLASYTGSMLLVSPKVDGVAGSLHYDPEGYLRVAVTRGDGRKGEVILPEILHHIAGIPLSIEEGPLEVRGEFYLPLSEFERFKGELANPRNAVAGALKAKSAKRAASLHMRFFAYDLKMEGDLKKSSEHLKFLEQLGFEPVPHIVIAKRAAECSIAYQTWVDTRNEIDYEIDGVCFRADKLEVQRDLGATSHHPRHSIAYKLQSESGVSRVDHIDWSVSRTGTVTPVAVIDPIQLSGAMITNVSLHNLNIARELGVGSGCTVRLTRRGGVIPQIEQVVGKKGKLTLPHECPSCGADVEERDGFLYCSKPSDCVTARAEKIRHFTRVMEIDGFGEVIVAQLVESGLVEKPVQLYDLKPKDLLPLKRVGPKKAEKLLSNVRSRASVPLHTFIYALGIPDVGRSLSRKLAAHFPDIDKMLDANVEKLMQLEGVGKKTAEAIEDWFYDHHTDVEDLLGAIEIAEKAEPKHKGSKRNNLNDKSFVFTGSLSTMTRSEATKKAEGLGAEVKKSVTADLTYLVASGGTKGSKFRKAERLRDAGHDLKIIDEEAFLKLIKE